MDRSLTGAVLSAYRDPRGAMRRQVAAGPAEARALAWLMLACLLYWVASVPEAARGATRVAAEDPVTAVLAANLFGFMVLAPLIFYGWAGVLHLGARAFGGTGGFAGARAALFWTLLLGAPLALALAALGTLDEAVPALARWDVSAWLGYAALAYWFWLLAAALAEAEGFSRARPIAAGFGLGFALVAVAVTVLLPAGPAAP
jgi:hypothetical protein